MGFILKQLLKASIRIEKKLDETLKLMGEIVKAQQKGFVPPPTPMTQAQEACPLCHRSILMLPVTLKDSGDTVIIRECGCEPQTNNLPMGEGEIQ